MANISLTPEEVSVLEGILNRWSDNVANKVIEHLDSFYEKPTYLLSTEKAARELNVCPSTMGYFKNKYKLNVQKISGTNWYDPEEIRNLADARYAEKLAASESAGTENNEEVPIDLNETE